MVSLNASIILASQISLASNIRLVDLVFLPNSSELYFRSVFHTIRWVTEPRPPPQLLLRMPTLDSQMNCFCTSCLQGPSDIMTSQGLNHKARHCALPFMRPALLRAQDSLRSEQIPTVWKMSYLNIDLGKLVEMLFSSLAAFHV
jgi:hypothetical protein